jgi:hypothetical protein
MSAKMSAILFVPVIMGMVCHCNGSDSVTDRQSKLEVLKNGSWTYIRSYFSPEQDIVISMQDTKQYKDYNGQMTFGHTRLVPCTLPTDAASFEKAEIFHYCGDDATPWFLNGTNIGGNHGCSDARELTAQNHGLTLKDIGSEWRDEAGTKFYAIKIASADKIWILSENTGRDGIWKFSTTIKGNTLKSSSGDKILKFEQAMQVQITPACRIKEQKYLVNGKTPLEDGKVTSCDFLDIVEEYDIIAPDSLLDMIRKNPGKEPLFTAKELDSVVTDHIVYRFLPMGACTVEHKSKANRKFNLTHMGFIQSAPLSKGPLDTHEYYIPKTLPFELKGRKYDFANFADYSEKLPDELLFGAKYKNISDAGNPPDRFIQFLGEKKNGAPARKIGFALGYSLIEGITRSETRAVNCEVPLHLYVTNKTYPRAIQGGTVEAGKEFHCLAYRQYFDASAYANATAVYWHKEVDSYLLYIDYHKAVDNDVIKLPDYLSSKKITVVEKTPSVKLLTAQTVPSDGIALSVDGQYGYIILKLE